MIFMANVVIRCIKVFSKPPWLTPLGFFMKKKPARYKPYSYNSRIYNNPC